MSVKEEIREYKRGKILDAALQLFYEKGFSGTSVEAVADRLGVTKPFIYTYFENKDALLTAIYEQLTDRLLDVLEQSRSQQDSPSRQLRAFVEHFARENTVSQMIATVYLQEEKHLDKRFLKNIKAREKALDRRLTELIQHGVDVGVFEVDDASVAALAITGMVRWIHRWFKAEGRLPAEEVVRLVSDLALNAVRCKEVAVAGGATSPQPAARKRSATVAKAGAA
ncbi:MAG: TetR/AcrR family transcriptional regulator [Burkholderiaceae bacterium]|nr:TetR/AcrR family transcriptional regulator [Burkholderiaceae bacterium]